MISRLLKIIRLFCRISSLLQGSFAKETHHFKEPANRSHPIVNSRIGTFTPSHSHTLELSFSTVPWLDMGWLRSVGSIKI